jgi:hypothetical protein
VLLRTLRFTGIKTCEPTEELRGWLQEIKDPSVFLKLLSIQLSRDQENYIQHNQAFTSVGSRRKNNGYCKVLVFLAM